MKVYFQTFGCQMNVADSEYIASMLVSSGNFDITNEIVNADLIIVNTCSVRKHAEDRASSYIGKLKELKNKNKNLKIIIIGCFAQRAKYELQEKFPFVDLVVGPLEYEYLPEILQQEFNLSVNKKTHLNLFNRTSVFVPIMTGCNNFCSYCIVPYVRGKERSRSVNDILDEIKFLLDNNAKEIILIGQNVNSYKFSETTFPQLLEKVVKIDTQKNFWVRFLTNHPKDMSIDIIKVIKNYPNISRHIHLPLQSGSNRILKLMNRNYTVEKYKEIIEMIRKEIPEISITTDLIVGFPTETNEDFKQTLNVVKEIEFDAAFVFKYSPRDGTKAAELKDDVPKEVKEERHFELLSLCDNITKEKNKKLIGTELEVLVTDHVVKNNKKDFYIGKTLNNKTVEIVSSKNNLVGEFIKVKINNTKLHSLLSVY